MHSASSLFPNMPFTLAVTGGIAEGKSTVVGYLRELGCTCVSADEIARDVWSDGGTQQKLAQKVGSELATNRKALMAHMAADPQLRRSVNLILHPPILSAMATSGATVFEVPLLIETCLHGLFKRVWVVTCGAEEQRARLLQRIPDRQIVDKVMSTQIPTEVKIAFADQIVRTNLPPFDVHSHVVSLARTLGLT